MKKENQLTKRQLLFCTAYLGAANLNGAKAARIAGYSEKNARIIARQNLTKLNILAFIESEMKKKSIIFDEIILDKKMKAFEVAGTNVVQKLQSVRKSLSEVEKPLEVYITNAIQEIKLQTGVTRKEQVDLILKAIEENQARMYEDIIDDTNIPEKIVKEIVKDLVEQKILKWVRRHVPKSPRKHYFLKSNRIEDVEGD